MEQKVVRIVAEVPLPPDGLSALALGSKIESPIAEFRDAMETHGGKVTVTQAVLRPRGAKPAPDDAPRGPAGHEV